MTLLEEWHNIFPNNKPTTHSHGGNNRVAIAGGDFAHLSNSRTTSSGRIRSGWQDDAWDEDHLYPLKGEVEMAMLGFMFNGTGQWYGPSEGDDQLRGLMGIMDMFHSQTANKSNAKIKALTEDITPVTSHAKQVRGQYRVMDKSVVNGWQSFNDEAAFNTSLIQTDSL